MAARIGPSLRVVARQSWALTLWTWYQLRDGDRIRQLIDGAEAVEHAILTSLAFNEPEKLDAERANARNAMRRTPEREVDLFARGRALAERIEAGGVLAD